MLLTNQPTNQPTNQSSGPKDTLKSSTCPTCGQVCLSSMTEQNGDGWRIFNGDFREVSLFLKPGIVDAIITDPPYGSGGWMPSQTMRSSKKKYVSSDASYQNTLPDIHGDALHPDVWKQLMRDFLSMAFRVLHDGGVFCIFIDWRNKPILQTLIYESGLQLRGVAVWDKVNSRPLKNGFMNQAEYILWGSKGAMPKREPTVYLHGVFRHTTKTNGKLHITEKPLALMQDLVKICHSGGLICDPFMGSGTTAIAALKQGCHFIGCESVGHYFDTSFTRIINAI